MKSKITFALLSLALVSSLIAIGTSRVSAESTSQTTFSDKLNSMADTIAQKLGLTSDQVKAVFEEAKNVRQVERQAQFEERLTQAVSEGVIDETQKQEISAKFKELQEKREVSHDTLPNMTPEERLAAHETQIAELESWAKEKGIPLTVLRGLVMGTGHHSGFKLGMGMGQPL